MENVLYFRLTDEELMLAAQVEYPWVDPRIWVEATRRGISARLNAFLQACPCASVARLCQWCLNPVRDDQPHVSEWGNRYWHTQCWNSMRAVDNADEPEDLRTCHEIGAERCPPRE